MFAADYLDDEETIAEYLTAALEDSNPDVFLVAVRDVARARAWLNTQKTQESGVKAFTRHSHPEPSLAMIPCSSCYMP